MIWKESNLWLWKSVIPIKGNSEMSEEEVCNRAKFDLWIRDFE